MLQATCPACRKNTNRPASHYTLYVCQSAMGRDFYAFQCDHCGEAVSIRCDPIVQRLLVAHRVKVRTFTLPAELTDPQRKSSVPLTSDDLLDLMNALREKEGAA